MRPVTTAAKLWPWKTPRYGEAVFVGVWTYLLWKKVCHTSTKTNVTGKGDSTRAWGAGLGVSKLSSSVHAALVPTGGSVLMLRSRGRKWHWPLPVFLEESLWMMPVWDMLLDEQITSPLCAPGALQISVSTLYICGLFAYLLRTELSLSQACWFLKLQA